jgi:hypothetical protein
MEVQFLHDLLGDWRHLLQNLCVLLIGAVGGQSTRDYSPSTTLVSGSVASAIGITVSA